MSFALGTVSPGTLLKLGRVSNLPTVWTNVLAATVLAGGNPADWRMAVAIVAMSLFYIGGMYLNDWFDRDEDTRECRKRPIPSGEISPSAVASIGISLFAAAIVILMAVSTVAALAGAILMALIVVYDAFHKRNPIAPLVMGVCRAMVYVATAATTGDVAMTLWVPATALIAYVAGLTYAARQEHFNTVSNLWPLIVLMLPLLIAAQALMHGTSGIIVATLFMSLNVFAIYLLAKRPRPDAVSNAVSLLIAGISLLDAAFLARADVGPVALVGVAGFCLTLLFQRFVPGT